MARLNNTAFVNVWRTRELASVANPKVNPTKNNPITKGIDHFCFVKIQYPVIKLIIPNISKCGGARRFSITKYPNRIIPTRR